MLVRNLHASILRFCSDFCAEHNMTVVNFDAHADESTMPKGDAMGFMGLSWEVDDHFLDVNVMFGVSTVDDTNLFRMVEKIAHLFEKLMPEETISVYDADSGEVVGNLVLKNGTRALPVGGSTSRPVQHIMVGLASTVTFD